MAVKRVCKRYRLGHYWDGTKLTPGTTDWTVKCRKRTLAHSHKLWSEALQTKSTLRPLYAQLKPFPWIEAHALSHSNNIEGRWLKLQARAGTLPLKTSAQQIYGRVSIALKPELHAAK